MAGNKNYMEFIDIPDGNGGSERWHAKDAEAQAAIDELNASVPQTYATKTELSQMMGPTYDAERECVVLPVTSTATYDSERGCVVFH